MSQKMIAIIDKPKKCNNCQLFADVDDAQWCVGKLDERGYWKCFPEIDILLDHDWVKRETPEWCPLKPYEEFIPIEWIKKWCNKEHNRKSLEERLLKRYGVITMLEDWEKENECNNKYQ